MRKFFRNEYFPIALSSIVASVFLVTLVASGGTTISANIQTDGTASSTSATTTNYLYVGENITELQGWDFSGGDLIVSGAAHFAAKATSTTAFAVGAGTINYLDMTGGDLYVQGDAEIDGTASTTSALNTQGTLNVGGTAKIGGVVTTTGEYFYMTALKLAPSATPTPAVAGKCFVNTTAADAEIKCHNGTDWQELW